MASEMIYNAEKGDISIAVAGDAMITRRMRAFTEPAFLELVDILLGVELAIVAEPPLIDKAKSPISTAPLPRAEL